jgi:hypothetical protein
MHHSLEVRIMNGSLSHPQARLVLGALALVAMTRSASAALGQPPPAARPTEDTPAYHRTLAEQHRAKALDLRRDAQNHQLELADFLRQSSMPPNKTGAERPWVKAKRQEPARLVREAEELANSCLSGRFSKPQ